MNDREQVVFEIIYPVLRSIYDQFVEEGFLPDEVFGVMLGIMAHEYWQNSSKAEFDEFLLNIAAQDWPNPEDLPLTKGKPNLRIVK